MRRALDLAETQHGCGFQRQSVDWLFVTEDFFPTQAGPEIWNVSTFLRSDERCETSVHQTCQTLPRMPRFTFFKNISSGKKGCREKGAGYPAATRSGTGQNRGWGLCGSLYSNFHFLPSIPYPCPYPVHFEVKCLITF